MAKILGILLIAASIFAAVVFFAAQPTVPKVVSTKADQTVAKLCLNDIDRRYSSKYLTYSGHTKAWCASWMSKLGIGLSSDTEKFLAGYTLFEEAVLCHVSFSGGASLNMALGPTEFEGTLSAISESYGIRR